MSNATLIDTTKCIGCRSCQVTCKQWNGNAGEKTQVHASLGLQNPVTLSAKTFALVTSTEIPDQAAPGGMRWVFTKRQCMHCDDPACASACPVTALHKGSDGKVTYDESKCIGCRYCMWACPFGAPTAEWDSLAPRIRKCTMCADREGDPKLADRNGQPLADEDRRRNAAAHAVPACVKQCPAGALEYGERTALLARAHARIARAPEHYHPHVYGEKEAGGTGMLYLTPVPPQEIGLPAVGTASYAARSKVALGAVPPAVVGVGAALGAVYALGQRRAAVAHAEGEPAAAAHHHVEFEPVPSRMLTPANVILGAIMAFGVLSFLARFALGLGKSTNLSDTWAWGLWIVFDLTWIAVAAGAFATAGLIYVFRRKDLYGLGRSAVLMGLLSYSFVTITLLADLGVPWHAWQLAVQAPEHSAMFEVSWCVGLYVTILSYEFMPVPLEHFGMTTMMAMWRRWSPAWVVIAVTLFVWIMSRNVVFAGAAFAVFALLAWAFRTREGEKPVPVMLAIAAVTLSTMHQSSLGSLFLLMPDKLSHLWWSPVMPLMFFLSSIAAGTALMVVVEFWIAKGFDRAVRIRDAAAMGQIAFWALATYQGLRIGDLVVRGQLHAQPQLGLLALELGLGGLVPLVLLGSAKLRQRPALLLTGAALATGGVVLNRVSVVALGMTLKGPMPQIAAASYSPSLVEWGISAGLIAATIFLFAWGVRVLPILPKEEQHR